MSKQQPSLFPTLDSVEAVVAMANAQLPIMTSNQLIAVLQVYANTLLNEVENKEENL